MNVIETCKKWRRKVRSTCNNWYKCL